MSTYLAPQCLHWKPYTGPGPSDCSNSEPASCAPNRSETRRDETRPGEGTVPKSPSSLWPSPHLARKSLDPFSFQMLTSVPCHRIPPKKEGKLYIDRRRDSCAEAHRTFGGQSVGIRAARHEPQELLGHPLPPHALGGEERKGAVPQAKPHLTPEPRESACVFPKGNDSVHAPC